MRGRNKLTTSEIISDIFVSFNFAIELINFVVVFLEKKTGDCNSSEFHLRKTFSENIINIVTLDNFSLYFDLCALFFLFDFLT